MPNKPIHLAKDKHIDSYGIRVSYHRQRLPKTTRSKSKVRRCYQNIWQDLT